MAAYNLTYQLYASNVAENVIWLTSLSNPSLTGTQVVNELATFFNTFTGNVSSDSGISQVAQLVGAPVEYVNVMYEFFGGGDSFVSFVGLAQEVIPTLGHPAAERSTFIGVFALLAVISTLAIVLRMYSRLTISGFIRSYDWILLVGALITFAYTTMKVVCTAGPLYYNGWWDRNYSDYILDAQLSLANGILYAVTTFLVKSSLLLFYFKLTTWMPLKITTCVTFGIVAVNTILMIFLLTFYCDPVIYWYGMNFMTVTCNTALYVKTTYGSGGVNIITDCIIWILPLPMVWKITQSTRERTLAILTFGIGALACIACGMRLNSVKDLLTTESPASDESKYNIWELVELYLAIICSCIPAIRALIIKKIPSLLTGSVDYAKGSAWTDGKTEKTGSDDKTKNGSSFQDKDISATAISHRSGDGDSEEV